MTALISVSPRRSSRPFSRTAEINEHTLQIPPEADGSSYRIKICALNYRTAEFCFKFNHLWELNSLMAPEKELHVTAFIPLPPGWRTEAASCFNLNIRST